MGNGRDTSFLGWGLQLELELELEEHPTHKLTKKTVAVLPDAYVTLRNCFIFHWGELFLEIEPEIDAAI